VRVDYFVIFMRSLQGYVVYFYKSVESGVHRWRAVLKKFILIFVVFSLSLSLSLCVPTHARTNTFQRRLGVTVICLMENCLRTAAARLDAARPSTLRQTAFE
jgi:hypothetical protein